MSNQFEFEGILYKGPQNGFYIDFPYNGVEEFGKRGPIRVKAWFEGALYRMSLLPKGNGNHWLHIKKEIRDKIGKSDGDKVHVVIEYDIEPPAIKVPDYLQWLLEDDQEMMEVFNNLSYSAKKGLLDYINEAKTDDARVHRTNKFFEYLNRYKK